MTKQVDLDPRDRRRALNETAFREINERVSGLNASFSEVTGLFSIVCECDDAACLDRIALRPAAYEAVRSDPTLFAVVPGHDSPAVEAVVERHDTYHVVRKNPGEPEAIAVANDPRSR